MTRKLSLLFLLALLPLAGCKKNLPQSLPFTEKKSSEAAPVAAQAKPGNPNAPAASTGGVPAAKPAAAAPTEAPKVPANTNASVMVLCYHRFEDRPKDSLAIKPSEFEQQMETLKKEGFTVIPMQTFLAWRRGEKEIPQKSCIISVDDGYRSGYEVGWPILKKFGYPFTMFIYTDYVKGQPKAGGQSLDWSELGEMRDAGVDIQCHTKSHMDLRMKKGKSPEQYEQWLREELVESKKMIERELGVLVNVLAYPYGNHNADVRRFAMEAGYQACFTVYGQRLTYNSPADQLGRYAIESTKPEVFANAVKMVGGGGTPEDSGPTISQFAAASMVTQPMEGETVNVPRPTLKANLATLGDIDPSSVQVRLSGIGKIPVKFDPATKMVEGQVPQNLTDPTYTVIVSATSKGRKLEARWSFNYKPAGAPPKSSAPATQSGAPKPGAATSPPPKSTPAQAAPSKETSAESAAATPAAAKATPAPKPKR